MGREREIVSHALRVAGRERYIGSGKQIESMTLALARVHSVHTQRDLRHCANAPSQIEGKWELLWCGLEMRK